MSVHTSSIYVRQTFLEPVLPASPQPKGFFLLAGQSEYCSSWLMTTLYLVLSGKSRNIVASPIWYCPEPRELSRCLVRQFLMVIILVPYWLPIVERGNSAVLASTGLKESETVPDLGKTDDVEPAEGPALAKFGKDLIGQYLCVADETQIV